MLRPEARSPKKSRGSIKSGHGSYETSGPRKLHRYDKEPAGERTRPMKYRTRILFSLVLLLLVGRRKRPVAPVLTTKHLTIGVRWFVTAHPAVKPADSEPCIPGKEPSRVALPLRRRQRIDGVNLVR